MPVVLTQAPLTPPQPAEYYDQQMPGAERSQAPPVVDEGPSRLRQAYDFASRHARNVLTDPALHRAAEHVGLKALEGSQIILKDKQGEYVLNTGELTIQLEEPKKAAKNLARYAVKPAAEQAAGHILRKLSSDSESGTADKKSRHGTRT